MVSQAELYDLLREAQASPIGVVVRTDQPERLRQKFYLAMKKVGLTFRIEAYEGEIWLVKK